MDLLGLKFDDLLKLSGQKADRTAEQKLIADELAQGTLTPEEAQRQQKDVANRKATTGTLVDVMTPVEIRESRLSDEEKRQNTIAADAVKKIQATLLDRQSTWLSRARIAVGPEDLFLYICIVVGCLVASKYFIANVATVISLVAAAIIIWWLIEMRTQTHDLDVKRLQIQMYEIKPAVKYFFVDIELIQLIRKGMTFRDWAPQTWDDAVALLDKFCQVRYQADPAAWGTDLVDEFALPSVAGAMGRCHSQITQQKDYMTQALNQMKSIIFNSPVKQSEIDRFTNFLQTLHLLLQRRLDAGIDACNTKATKPTKLYKSHPEPTDTAVEPHYGLFV
jgi:hypothetical protein